MRIIDNKPTLFEKSNDNIWTDPYIQLQILSRHLDTLSDGATRRPKSVLKIIDFILLHTKQESRLLDLGCGPGVYASLLADKKHIVTGIDFNKVSIEYAIEKRKDIRYIIGDYIKDYPSDKYDTVIMIYCDIGTHSDSDRDQLLKNIYHSLDYGGIFIFDVFSEEIIRDKYESKDWKYTPFSGFWAESEHLLLSQTFHYPKNKVFAYQHNLICGNSVKHFIIWERYYSEKEIVDLLKSTGFRTISIHKDLLGKNDFTSNSEMFIVAEK